MHVYILQSSLVCIHLPFYRGIPGARRVSLPPEGESCGQHLARQETGVRNVHQLPAYWSHNSEAQAEGRAG